MTFLRVCLMFSTLAVSAVPALAASPFSSDSPAPPFVTHSAPKPLMVIHFNQQKVHFERQIYSTLEQVVAVKPDVLFDIVSVIPGDAGDQNAPSMKEIAGRNGHKVFDSMVQMGVPASRIHYSELYDPSFNANEVRLYAR